jgi:putative membrane protein insertion efficiency factor
MKKLRAFLLLALLVIVIHDLATPPRHHFGTRAAVFAIDQYRSYGSPLVSKVVRCRFQPSCSRYGREAFLKYGFWKGTFKTVGRIARCGPWTAPNTPDPP